MIGFKPPRYPQFRTFESRNNTFEQPAWTINLNPVDFANSGFFSEGVEDAVKCFWCGCGLERWGPLDRPWKEHAKYSPRCPWIIRCKGRQYIKQILIECVTRPSPVVTPNFDQRFQEKLAKIKTETHEIRGILSNTLFHLCTFNEK